MLQIFKKRIKNQKGFTLIELIVVIAIIGILSAIAVPRLSGFREEAVQATVIANDRIMRGAAEMWLAQNGVGTEQTWTENGTEDVDWQEYVTEWPEYVTEVTIAANGDIDVVTDPVIETEED